jgi:ribosome-binding factor A
VSERAVGAFPSSFFLHPFTLEAVPRDFPRSRRIAEQIQRELSEIVRVELKDPRVGMITLTDVEVTADGDHAKVFFTVLGDPSRVDQAVEGLQHAAGYLRSQLARRLTVRIVPHLQFKYDPSVERGARLSQLIDLAVAEDTRRNADTKRNENTKRKKRRK